MSSIRHGFGLRLTVVIIIIIKLTGRSLRSQAVETSCDIYSKYLIIWRALNTIEQTKRRRRIFWVFAAFLFKLVQWWIEWLNLRLWKPTRLRSCFCISRVICCLLLRWKFDKSCPIMNKEALECVFTLSVPTPLIRFFEKDFFDVWMIKSNRLFRSDIGFRRTLGSHCGIVEHCVKRGYWFGYIKSI